MDMTFKLQGEEGIDAGGIKKEVWRIVGSALFKDDSVFDFFPKAVRYWFKLDARRDVELLKKIRIYGWILAVAFNQCALVNWNMPSYLFKCLVSLEPVEPSWEDLHDIYPEPGVNKSHL